MTETGFAISSIRHSKGMSQLELAQKAMIPQSNLSDIESGKRDLTVTTLRNIARALNVSAAALVEDGPDEPSVILTRQRVERIADAVFADKKLSPQEQEIVRCLRVVCSEYAVRRISGRAVRQAWAELRAAVDPAGIKVLLQKVRDASMRVHEKKAD